ncbi:MAG TPA: signal peptidase II [Gemmatimonadaceae bacterium]
MPSLSAKRLRFWLPLAVVVVLDIVSKAWAERALDLHVPVEVVGDFARWNLVYNEGAAFGTHLGDWSRVIFTLLAALVLVFLGRIYKETAADDRQRLLALGLVCGGAVGNLVDRIRHGLGVVDFIDLGVGAIRFWTFNVADSAVTIGAILLAWSLWREPEPQAERS